MASKGENIRKINDYLYIKEYIEDFCERVIDEYWKYDNLKHDTYPTFSSFEIFENEDEPKVRTISIKTEHTCWHETDYEWIDVPIEVFYDDNVEEYVKNLSEQRTKKEEQEKKEKEERDKQRAEDEIKRLKEKYNI